MGTLYLTRHGQASFGAADYDNLSDLGHRQSVRLGEYWRHKGLVFDAVLMGTLKRHAQTYAGICKGLHAPGETAMAPLLWPGLNEYDSAAVIAAIHPEPLDKPDSPEKFRAHFRLLREALTAWMNGQSAPQGMPSYPDFCLGVTSALDHVRGLKEPEGPNGQSGPSRPIGNVLIVSSGGPISTAVGHVLGTAPATTIELNLRIRNTAVTEFAFTPKRHMLQTFNGLPHLDSAEHQGWITSA